MDRLPVNSGDELLSLRTRQLYDWWIGFASARPQREDFDVVNHRRLVPYLYLYHIYPPNRVDIRINGEVVADAFGHSWAKTMLSTEADDPVHVMLAQYLLTIAEEGRPYRCIGTLSHVDRGYIRFESVDLPLWGDDGTVTHIVGVLDPDYSGHEKFGPVPDTQAGD